MAGHPAGLESAVKSCCPHPLPLPGRARPAAGPHVRAPGQGCMAAVSGASQRGAAPAERPALSPAHGTAARLLLQLPPSSCSSSSSPRRRRRRDPGHSCCSWAMAAAGTRGFEPRHPGLGSTRDPPGPAAPRRSSAPPAPTAASGSGAAHSAPAPAPPLGGELSRVPARVRWRPQPSRPQVPPPAPPSLAAPGRGGALGQRAPVTKFQLPAARSE